MKGLKYVKYTQNLKNTTERNCKRLFTFVQACGIILLRYIRKSMQNMDAET